MLCVLAIASSLLLLVQVTSGIPLSEFYPFGREAGDSALQGAPAASRLNFPFFRRADHSYYVVVSVLLASASSL